jgi:putative tryptophan/tyrosine transport system substrate-binding protein
MNRRAFVVAVGGLASAVALAARAQQPKAQVRISFISHSSQNTHGHLLQEFRTGLRVLGYTEGRDLMLDLWWAEDRLDRLPALIAEALSSRPSMIVTHGSASVAALQKATSTIPIVFAAAGDPVGQGFVKSFRRPGANITGIAFNDEITPKIFELVKLVMPRATRIAGLLNPHNPASRLDLGKSPAIAKALGFELLLLKATSRETLEPAFIDAAKAKMQAIVVAPHAPLSPGLVEPLGELQFRYRLPAFYGVREGVSAGGLASYSFPLEENFRRAAALVDQILKGGSPSEIPVEIPTKYEIAINLKTANALGIKVPEAALLRAHKVIAA